MHIIEFRVEWNQWRYDITKEKMLVLRSGEVQVEICLAPIVEGEQTSIASWSVDGNGLYRAALNRGGSVCLQVREGNLAYWMETDLPQFEKLEYFPGTKFKGNSWQTYVSDGYDRLWEKCVDVEVPVSSAYDDIMHVDGADGAGLTDPGDFPPTFVWNMPTRAFSFKTSAGWLGFAIPGALPVGVTRLKMYQETFTLRFEVLRPACPDGGMPVVYLVTGLQGAYDVLDEERAVSGRLGLTVKKSPDHPNWWAGPGFKAYLEQHHLYKLAEERAAKEHVDCPSMPSMISLEKFASWIRTVKKDLRLKEMYAILEQGAYRYYGDYRPTDALGGPDGFRKLVDELRAENVRMCFYIHPFMCNTKVDFYRKHPEAFCKPKKTGHKTGYALEVGDANPEFALVDWTHPLGREYILGQVEMILSEKAGCLNCDWLRSNHWRSPDPRVYDFHDPDWGIGDLMSMKVQKALYKKAKSIKPYACVSKAGLGASYMQPYADVALLAEEWNGWTDTWYRRGRLATRLLGDMLYLMDPYFLTITKSYEYYMGMAVWVMMEDPIVKHAIHPYLYFRELKEKDFRRRRAGVQVQLNAPLNITDECRVEPVENGVRIWRKRTQGPLAGWYASMAFGKRCFATFSEKEARVAASETRTIELPLPPGAVLKDVQMLPHENEPEDWAFEQVVTNKGPGLRLRVEDCGKKALYYRVRYVIK